MQKKKTESLARRKVGLCGRGLYDCRSGILKSIQSLGDKVNIRNLAGITEISIDAPAKKLLTVLPVKKTKGHNSMYKCRIPQNR